MYAALRPLLFALPPAQAHAAGMLALWPLEHLHLIARAVRAVLGPRGERVAVDAMGLRFPSPVGVAGGFDKNGTRAQALAALGFGFVEVGTVTAQAQGPNPAPNLFRLPADRALVNRLGFPNEGAARVVGRLLERGGAKALGVPLAVSIGKSRSVPLVPIEAVIADYMESLEEALKVADFVIVNVSSPNTKGLRALQDEGAARSLLGALADRARASSAPMLLKIAPDIEDADLATLLAVVKEVRLDGVVCANTTVKREGLATPADVVDGIGAGGLSGPPVRARAVELVRRARAALGPKATIIGVGGIEKVEHVRALLEAGANLVQLYTGFVYEGPLLPSRLARELERELTAAGIPDVSRLGVPEASVRTPSLAH